MAYGTEHQHLGACLHVYAEIIFLQLLYPTSYLALRFMKIQQPLHDQFKLRLTA